MVTSGLGSGMHLSDRLVQGSILRGLGDEVGCV
jgi:hypothetical protein